MCPLPTLSRTSEGRLVSHEVNVWFRAGCLLRKPTQSGLSNQLILAQYLSSRDPFCVSAMSSTASILGVDVRSSSFARLLPC